MAKENIRRFSAIINNWDFFNFLKDEHYQTQIAERLGKDKKYIRDKITTYEKQELIKEVKKIGRKIYYKDTDETLDMIKYLLKYEFKEVSEIEIPIENEVENILKRFKDNNISVYNDAVKDFEAVCKEKILKFKPSHIKMLKQALSTSDPKKQKGKEHLLFGLLNVVETLNDEFEVELLNNYFENFKGILGKICINGISKAEGDQVISSKCQGISIFILIILNKESGINTIFEMIEKIPDDNYSQSDFLQSTVKSEMKKIVTNSKEFKVLILNRFKKLLVNPNHIIRERAEELKNIIRKDLL